MRPTTFFRLLGIGMVLASPLAMVTHALSDVTQPGDPLIPSSTNNPGSEAVGNAIDNQPTKYLNFDAGTGIPVGFIVSPSVGLTRVTGISLQSANDAPERDPMRIRIEGSIDPTVTGWAEGRWEVIYENNAIPSWQSVFGESHRYQTQTFLFDNLKAYRHYRFTVLEVQNVAAANSFQIAEVELLGRVVPADVTQPGDPLIPSSTNNPGSEAVGNAIDNQPTKYLNFDAGTGIPVGFIVSPSIGSTLISGISLQSANDAPERDPMRIRIEGSNDEAVTGWADGNWVTIYENMDIPSWQSVFGDQHRYQTQTFLFENYVPYRHYRFTVLEVQNVTAANSFQIAEVELHGTGAPVDVTQPGDPLIPSSTNNPGSEAVGNAIDNQPTKYLNFDAGTGIPVGFIVTPSVGATTIIGITLQSANDAPERDPMRIRIEGSNDETVTGWAQGNWSVIYENNAIPSWQSVFGEQHRYRTQAFYFPNETAYLHYRFTVLEVQNVAAANSFQIAEVEFLAVTDRADCNVAAFLTPPVDTPVLLGQSATFFTEVNGPWPLQWYRNGAAIPGATKTTYTTPPVTAANADDLYSVEIVGCTMSLEVQAVIFTPSSTISYGLSFLGAGANGAPTAVDPADIAGFWQQAYWNNLEAGSQTDLPLTNSNGQVGEVTVTFSSSGTWGSGTGTDTADARMLNGLIEGGGAGGTITFNNVPAGNHAVITYSVARPLEFPNINITVGGQTLYARQMNADEYNPAPGFYSITSTDPANRSVGNMARFSNVSPVNGQVTVSFINAGGGSSTINGLQLILNAPDPGAPPAITQQPRSANILEGRRAVVAVTATGAEPLHYQWRKDGFNLFNTGRISGVNSATLSINNFSQADQGRYDVAISNPAGTVVSAVAALNLTTGAINDRLVGHWKLDETAGNTAANAVAGGAAGQLRDFFSPGWRAGRINNALYFDSMSYVFVENYPKASRALSVSAWVNYDWPATTGQPYPIIRNWGTDPGQFTLGFTGAEPSFLQGQVRVGPNTVTASTSAAGLPNAQWHHVALTADGARVTLYLNGQPVAATDYIGTINTPPMNWLAIGTVLDNAGALPVTPSYLWGMLDDIGLWTRPLSRAEVAAIHQAGLQGRDLSTVVIEIEEEPEITSIRVDNAGNVVIDFIGVLVYSATVNGNYAPVQGATSPYIATQPGFYQAMGQ